MRNNRVAEAHPGVRKDTGGRQLRAIAGKSWIKEEAALAIPIPLDLCSTEDHGHHLQNEVARERVFTLRPSNASVKSENGNAVADWRESEQ